MEIVILLVIALCIVGAFEAAINKYGLEKIEYSLSFSKTEAHEGDELYLVEEIYNKKIIPVPWLKVEIFSSKWLEFAETRSVLSQDTRYVTSCYYLKSHQKTTRKWKLKCTKRGIFDIKNAVLLSGGFVIKSMNSSMYDVDAKLTVYPAILETDKFLLPYKSYQGDVTVKRWIIDDPFIISGAREYTMREPLSKIHWNATAREGRLMVKQNDFTSELNLCILYNCQEMEYEYKRSTSKTNAEYGIKIAAGLLDKALNEGTGIRLITNGRVSGSDGSGIIFSKLSSGRAHITFLMELLAQLDLTMTAEFGNLLKKMSEKLFDEDVIIISSYINLELIEQIRILKNISASVTLIICDPHYNSSLVPEDIVMVKARQKDIYDLNSVTGKEKAV